MKLEIEIIRKTSVASLTDEKDHCHRREIKTAFLKRMTINDLINYIKR